MLYQIVVSHLESDSKLLEIARSKKDSTNMKNRKKAIKPII